MDKEQLKQEMRDEIDCMDESSRLLAEYNSMFGKEVTPDEITDY